jgi:hypothetical protein
MAKLNDCTEGGPSQDEVTACDLQSNHGHFECADAAAAESEAVSDRASDEREDEPEQGDMEAEDEELELGSSDSLNATQDNEVQVWVLPMELVRTYYLCIITSPNELWHLKWTPFRVSLETCRSRFKCM